VYHAELPEWSFLLSAVGRETGAGKMRHMAFNEMSSRQQSFLVSSRSDKLK
jgi:hypothetical protein